MPLTFTALLAALSSTNDAVILRQTSTTTDYDAIIVGGGPAGLSALSGLARVRRNVLLIDSGVYRNAPTRHMHDVLGFDGTYLNSYPHVFLLLLLLLLLLTNTPSPPHTGVTPAYFRHAARQQVSHYSTISMINGTVTKITSGGDNQNTFFTLTTTLSPSNSLSNLTARKVILATGLRDILPSTPGVREN